MSDASGGRRLLFDAGEDFDSIRKLMSYNYPRAADIPSPGFAAGPCLFKDTMQLSSFSNKVVYKIANEFWNFREIWFRRNDAHT